ncbi:MAG: hypothetical protein BA864_13800 [Desulfuromonadales bacterium C00003093]|nr:MAG: hypothetical protein BA864_13800 [Desulfuromonadales bacterium C00003093]
MSGREWQWPLEKGENLLWQGRPAPRCFTFKNWKLAGIGIVLFLASSFWLMLSIQLVRSDNHSWWLVMIPLPVVVLSLCLGPGQLFWARWRWEQIYYALSDQRLFVRIGSREENFLSYPLAAIRDWKQKRFGSQLASVQIHFAAQKPVVLDCLEQPQILLNHLDSIVRQQEPAGESV